MNIKSLVNNISPLDVRPTAKAEKTIKSDESHERDANGQQAFDQGQQHKEPMTDEQIEKCLEHLRNLPSTIEHKWTISLDVSENGKFVLVKDNLGNVIRKIPELELWTLSQDKGPKGQLLKKSA